MRLSAKQVEQCKKRPGRYGDGAGLYLQVKSPTNASWQFRYERNGRERWMGLGPLHTFSLSEARARARETRQQLYSGIDPLDARRKQRAEALEQSTLRKTFQECAETYYESAAEGWTNSKHRAQFMSTMKAYVFPKIGRVAVADVNVGMVLDVLEQNMPSDEGRGTTSFWKARPETASRVRGRIEKVLNWAKVRGYRSGDNPAQWQGFLSTQLPPRGKHVAPVGKCRAFV